MLQRIPKFFFKCGRSTETKKIAGKFQFSISFLFAKENCAHSMQSGEMMGAEVNVNSERTVVCAS